VVFGTTIIHFVLSPAVYVYGECEIAQWLYFDCQTILGTRYADKNPNGSFYLSNVGFLVYDKRYKSHKRPFMAFFFASQAQELPVFKRVKHKKTPDNTIANKDLRQEELSGKAIFFVFLFNNLRYQDYNIYMEKQH
jgi:hypothetical protein